MTFSLPITQVLCLARRKQIPPYNVSSWNKPAFSLLSCFPCLFSRLWSKKRKTLSTVKSCVADYFVIRKNGIISSVLQFVGKMYLHSKIMSPFTLRPEIPVSSDGVSISGPNSDHTVPLFFCFHITNSTLGICIPRNKILLQCRKCWTHRKFAECSRNGNTYLNT